MPSTKSYPVSIPKVDGFHELSSDDAKKVMYEICLPLLEKKGVLLTPEGQVLGHHSKKCIEEYYDGLKNRNTFNIENIQKICKEFGSMTVLKKRDHNSSYGLKHWVEDYLGDYVANGDLIMAFLLMGEKAYWWQKDKRYVNCTFKRDVPSRHPPKKSSRKRRRLL